MKMPYELPRAARLIIYAWLRAEVHARTGSFDSKFWGKVKRSAGRRPFLVGYTQAHARADTHRAYGKRGQPIVERLSRGNPVFIDNMRPSWRRRGS